MPSTATHLDKLSRAVLDCRDQAESLVHKLSPDQLLWRPTPNRWSVAEWFEHLVALGEDYQSKVREPMLAAWHDPSFEDAPYRQTFAGRCAVLGARVRAGRSRGRGHLIPPPATATAPARFLQHQSEFLDLLAEAREVDLGRIRLGSPVGRLIGLNLGDVFELLVVHQHHGLSQAARVVDSPEFPARHPVVIRMLADMRQTA